jgi:hypothetical protein
VDVILFSVYEHGYKQCGDTALGTYVASVPNYLQGYLKQKAQDAEDQGQDYEWPDASQYAACIPYQINDNWYYFQLGCSDETNVAITVNAYEDDVCTKRSSLDSSDIPDIDVSTVQVRLRKSSVMTRFLFH